MTRPSRFVRLFVATAVFASLPILSTPAFAADGLPLSRPRSRRGRARSTRGSARSPGGRARSARGSPRRAPHRRGSRSDRRSPRSTRRRPRSTRGSARLARGPARSPALMQSTRCAAGEETGGRAGRPASPGAGSNHSDRRPARPTRCCAHGQHRPAVRRPVHRARCVRRARRACRCRRRRGRGRHPVHAGSLDAQRGHQGRRAPRRAGDRDSQAPHAARSGPEGPDLHQRHDRSRRGRDDRASARRSASIAATPPPTSCSTSARTPTCATRPDCVQYAPVTKNVLLWDIFPGSQAAARYVPDQWNHVKLVVSGRRLRVWVNGGAPALDVTRLEGDAHDGAIVLPGHRVPGQREGDAGRGRRARSASRTGSDREGRPLRPQLDGVAGLDARRGRDARTSRRTQPDEATGRRCPPKPEAW